MFANALLPPHPLSASNAQWRIPAPTGILDQGAIPKPDHRAVQRLHDVTLQIFNQAGLPVQIIETVPGPWFCQVIVEAVQGAGQGFLARLRQQKFNIQKSITDQTNFIVRKIDNPIPRRPRAQIQVINPEILSIPLQPVLTSPIYQQTSGNLIIPLGVDLSGQPAAADLTTFPNLLIGGITGAGKSVFLNSLLAGLLCHYSPDQLRFLFCDGNMVELSPYKGIPHLVGDVATQPEEILPMLDWLKAEIHQRLEATAREIARLPFLVTVIEHTFIFTQADPRVCKLLTDILSLAPRARVHFIFTDSHPDARVLPAAVKQLIPARACFSVVSTDASRLVLGQSGAEELYGHGDYLFLSAINQPIQRYHACMLSRREFLRLIHFWKDEAFL